MPSPLTKYQRQPKNYIDLPSQGRWYAPGSLEKHKELEVYSMTASDEIATKTPDALLSGNATASIIKNCVPAIKDPWQIPMVDIYTILSAIRMASYGDTISVNNTCSECGAENKYEVGLQNMITHFGQQTFVDSFEVDNFKINLRPLNYKTFNEINKENFKLQRTISQTIPTITDQDTQAEETQKIFDALAQLKMQSVMFSISSIIVDGEEENNPQAIQDFMKNAEKHFYTKAEDLLVKNNENFGVPPTAISCSSCSHNSDLSIEMDYSNFFAQG